MPKEKIRNRYNRNVLDDSDPGLLVQVGWSREAEHVELSTINDDSIELKPTPEGNGWFVQLDRYGINELIRVLRRARDQAFGRDE